MRILKTVEIGEIGEKNAKRMFCKLFHSRNKALCDLSEVYQLQEQKYNMENVDELCLFELLSPHCLWTPPTPNPAEDRCYTYNIVYSNHEEEILRLKRFNERLFKNAIALTFTSY